VCFVTSWQSLNLSTLRLTLSGCLGLERRDCCSHHPRMRRTRHVPGDARERTATGRMRSDGWKMAARCGESVRLIRCIMSLA
jgi:hypothetical protein